MRGMNKIFCNDIKNNAPFSCRSCNPGQERMMDKGVQNLFFIFFIDIFELEIENMPMISQFLKVHFGYKISNHVVFDKSLHTIVYNLLGQPYALCYLTRWQSAVFGQFIQDLLV